MLLLVLAGILLFTIFLLLIHASGSWGELNWFSKSLYLVLIASLALGFCFTLRASAVIATEIASDVQYKKAEAQYKEDVCEFLTPEERKASTYCNSK